MFRYLEYYYNRRTFHLLTIIFSAILMVFSAFYLIRLYSVNCVAEAVLVDLRADDTVYLDYSVRISYRYEFSNNAKFIPKKPGDCYDVRIKATLYSGESAEKTVTAKNAHFINLYAKDYDGQNFPAYVYDQMLCFLRAEYNEKTEFLYLPCEEEAIDKAFARLGAPTPDDVELSWEDICIDSDKWIGRFKEIAAEEGVYELNRLAAAVNSADMDLEKLWAVAEYGKAEDAKQLSRLAENLDCFTFIIGASNYEEVGIYVTENNANFSVNPSVEKFFDYKAFGKYIGDAYYGEFVDGGFIYNDTDTSLLDILYQDEPMTMGGM